MAITTVAQMGGGEIAIPVSLAAFTPLAEAWDLSSDEQIKLLGSPPRSTFFKWKKEGTEVPRDTGERISHLLAIWKALEILFTDPVRSQEWLKRKNEFFGGLSALDIMLERGDFSDIVKVRQYLDAQRGG